MNNVNMSLDKESQFDEISSLESIYNNEEFTFNKENEVYSGQFLAMPSVSPGFTVKYKNLLSEDYELKTINIDYLPPICLYFELPHDYPSTSPPIYKLSCPWLGLKQIISLCDKLEEFWAENEGMVILFTWMNFLKNESLDYLQITDSLDISFIHTKEIRFASKNNTKDGGNDNFKEKGYPRQRFLQNSAFIKEKDCLNNTIDAETSSTSLTCSKTSSSTKICHSKQFSKRPSKRGNPVPQRSKKTFVRELMNKYGKHILKQQINNILEYLVWYNEDRSKTEFRKTLFPCEICFQNQMGLKCTQFKPCNHIYCSECIFSYFEVRIKENVIHSMPCPHEKCTSEASQNQIKEIVGPELFSRYDSLLLNATLDTMADIVYCPRKSCQLPVLLELPERMALCPKCNYAFCAFCKMTYHGIEPCRMRTEEKKALALEYENSVGEERRRLEARYGQKQLITLLENVKSTDWISTHSKNCPSCFASIEKSDGCNKMVCGKCNTMFCWLCGSKLNSATPYKHFFDPKSECNNLLFQGLQGVEDDDDYFLLDDDDGFLDDEEFLYAEEVDEEDYIFFDL